METITIEEFKNLVPADSLDRVGLSGKFGISLKLQTKQCENPKVGDTVFFLSAVYKGLGEDNVPECNMTLTQARLVEDE